MNPISHLLFCFFSVVASAACFTLGAFNLARKEANPQTDIGSAGLLCASALFMIARAVLEIAR